MVVALIGLAIVAYGIVRCFDIPNLGVQLVPGRARAITQLEGGSFVGLSGGLMLVLAALGDLLTASARAAADGPRVYGRWAGGNLDAPASRGGPARARLCSSLVTSALEHSVRVQLRWRDMDMLGHLNQSVYHELLEEGRAALMTEVVRRVGTSHTHGSFVLAHVDLDYHAEVRKDHEEVEIVVRLAQVGKSSLRLDHEVRLPDGNVAASGKTVLVAWDPASRSKRALTNAELAALA